MPIKRKPSEAELEALAERFKALWREGDILRPWLRKHQEIMRELVHDDWSWASVADALTRAGITWRTERAWSAEGLRREIVRASRPLKAGKRAPAKTEARTTGTAAQGYEPPPAPLPTEPKSQFEPARLKPAAPQVPPGPAQAAVPPAPKVPRFEAFTLKDQEPPRQLTPEEQKERAAIRKRFS